MEKMTASRAKQNFGELLEAVVKGPVAIERHKSIKAIVCSPATFHGTAGGYSSPDRALEDRRAARTAQQLVERNRLIKHQKLAIDLLLMPQGKREKLIARALKCSGGAEIGCAARTTQIDGTSCWIVPLGTWRMPCARRRLHGAPLCGKTRRGM